jgi:hypothetical protein
VPTDLIDRLGREQSPSRADHILRAIEDGLTPAELQAALPLFDRLTGVARSVCKKSPIISLLRRESPEGYIRTKVAPDVVRFASDKSASQGKSLIVAFCGRSHRLMTSWSHFLQSVPASKFEVVIMADRSNDHFMHGIPGYAPDLYSLVNTVAVDFDVKKYRHVFCYGTSTGGFAALRAGLLMNAFRAISVGGHPVWHINRLLDPEAEELPAFDPLCACEVAYRCHLVCIYAAGSTTDCLSAMRLPETLNVSRIPIAGTSQHNVVYEIFKRGALKAFYRQLFHY